ncbi:MAG: DUF4199 domain-containing protein [Pseudomonadota bacterium]
MIRLLLTYGVPAGLFIILSMILGIELGHSQEWLGYLIMFIVFSVIFVAVKRHRDVALGGVISFGNAFLVGLGISAVAGVVYVAVWEYYSSLSGHAFIDNYTNYVIESIKASDRTPEEMAVAIADAEKMAANYRNPLFRLPMTFLEVFPPGVLVSLGSAIALRNHKTAG